MDIPFTAHVFLEGGQFVAHAPALDVSSCGETADQARHNIRDAVRGFVQVAEERGTLADILLEGGYRFESGHWLPPAISTEMLRTG